MEDTHIWAETWRKQGQGDTWRRAFRAKDGAWAKALWWARGWHVYMAAEREECMKSQDNRDVGQQLLDAVSSPGGWGAEERVLCSWFWQHPSGSTRRAGRAGQTWRPGEQGWGWAAGPGERRGCWHRGGGSRGGNPGLDSDSVLQVVRWSFRMDWLWVGGWEKKHLLSRVHFPSTTYSRTMSVPSKRWLEEGESMISANSLWRLWGLLLAVGWG